MPEAAASPQAAAASAPGAAPPAVSIVVPVYNERENLAPLLDEIAAALAGRRYEVVAVDDGSGDGSGEGLVAEFKGTGTLYLQTRSMNSFIDWLMPFLPKGG